MARTAIAQLDPEVQAAIKQLEHLAEVGTPILYDSMVEYNKAKDLFREKSPHDKVESYLSPEAVQFYTNESARKKFRKFGRNATFLRNLQRNWGKDPDALVSVFNEAAIESTKFIEWLSNISEVCTLEQAYPQIEHAAYERLHRSWEDRRQGVSRDKAWIPVDAETVMESLRDGFLDSICERWSRSRVELGQKFGTSSLAKLSFLKPLSQLANVVCYDLAIQKLGEVKSVKSNKKSHTLEWSPDELMAAIRELEELEQSKIEDDNLVSCFPATLACDSGRF